MIVIENMPKNTGIMVFFFLWQQEIYISFKLRSKQTFKYK